MPVDEVPRVTQQPPVVVLNGEMPAQITDRFAERGSQHEMVEIAMATAELKEPIRAGVRDGIEEAEVQSYISFSGSC